MSARGSGAVLPCAVLVLALACVPLHAARAQSALPDAPEKALLEDHCGQCHELQRLEESGGTVAGWTTRIRRMMRRGSNLPPEQIDALAAYLARWLPPRVREQTVNASPVQTTVSEVARRSLQVWTRTAGVLQGGGNVLVARLSRAEAAGVEVGQRVRAFPLESKSSMQQGKVVSVDAGREGASIQVELGRKSAGGRDYLLEIVGDRGALLSVPNEALIEEDGRRLVYVQHDSGGFVPREVATGVEGELYTQVLSGVEEGERVVTFGSFFIDAEYKMKATFSDEAGLAIQYSGRPDPPHSGSNAIEVVVREKDDAPVTDATVEVSYSMAAMPSMNMPEMHDVFTLAHRGAGSYEGTANLSMAGTWQVTVSVSRGGEAIATKTLTVIARE